MSKVTWLRGMHRGRRRGRPSGPRGGSVSLARSRRRAAVALAIAVAAMGCWGPWRSDEWDRGSTPQGIVIGADESFPVSSNGSNVPTALVPVLDAIGRLAGTACSAGHIGNHLVLTAAHCVMAESIDDCSSTAVEWGIRGDFETGISGRCVRILFAELTSDRDLALFEIDHAPDAQLRIDVCRTRGPGDRVFLLSHPGRRSLEWSGSCMLEPTPESVVGRGRVGHTCDSEAGSSGGPLLDAETLEVVGIHVGGAGAINQATLLSLSLDLFKPEGWSCSCDS